MAAPPLPRPALARRDTLPSATTRTPPSTAAELLGAGPEALRRRLGEPSLRRAEGRAEVWLYAAEGCALDLVLYPEAGSLRVAHAEARASGAEPLTEAACLRGIGAPPASPPFAAGAGGAPGPRDPGI